MAGGIIEQRHSFLSLCGLSIKCVYVFLDGETPVYIGKTSNTKKRFEPYKYFYCHNVKLNNWLTANNLDFNVIVYLCDDIDTLEKTLIKKHKDTLFNISNGNEADWFLQSSNSLPWVAGRGILSPSSYLLSKSKDSERKAVIKQWTSNLPAVERCTIEVWIAMQYPMKFTRWLDITSDRLIARMEDKCHQAA